MADKSLQEGDPEAVPYATINFTIMKKNKAIASHQGRLSRHTAIAGLKEDLEDELGASADLQSWSLNGELMDDNKTLEDYNILGFDDENIIVQILE